MGGTPRRTFSHSQGPPLRSAFSSYVVKDEFGKGGFVFPSDFNFKNPEILLHLRRNFYKVLGGGKKEGVFTASLVDEAVQFRYEVEAGDEESGEFRIFLALQGAEEVVKVVHYFLAAGEKSTVGV